jgi:hypothetical protein
MIKERFSKLPIPVHKISVSDLKGLYEAFPGLKRYFNSIPKGITDLRDLPVGRTYQMYDPIEQAKVVKYIVFMYDPESDLIHEYPEDVRLRKEAAAKEAGYDRDPNGNFSDYIVSIMDFKEPQVIEWILDFLKARKNYTWNEIVFIEEEIDLLSRNRVEALRNGKVEAGLMKLMEERTEKRTILYKKFWAETGDLKEHADRKLFPISPENVFAELQVPAEVWGLRQIIDVSKTAGVQEEAP